MSVPILAYHKVQTTLPLDASNTTPAQFERQMRWLREHGYRSISLKDYVEGQQASAKAVIITFDDAYESVFHNAAPVLEKYGLTATIFVIAKFVNQWNTWDIHFAVTRARHCSWEQIRRLEAKGWEIGSHTVSHPDLCRMRDAELWCELRYSKAIIERNIQSTVAVVAYPFGRFNRRVVKIARSAGYTAGCTLGDASARTSDVSFGLNRKGVYYFEPFALFRAKIENSYLTRFDTAKQRAFSCMTQCALLWRSGPFAKKTV